MLRAVAAGLVLVLAGVPAFAEVTCFTHFEIGILPGTEWGPAGPAVGDFDGDGDTDLISKVWNTGGRAYHADLWRNDNPACPAPGAGARRTE